MSSRLHETSRSSHEHESSAPYENLSHAASVPTSQNNLSISISKLGAQIEDAALSRENYGWPT